MDAINVQFIPVEGDYIRAESTIQRKQGAQRQAIFIYGLLGLLIVLYFVFYRGWSETSLIMIVVLLIMAVLGFLVAPFRKSKAIRSNKQLLMPLIYSLDDRGVIVKNALTETLFVWQNFREMFETPDCFYFLFKETKNQYLYVPRRAFETPQQMDAFRAFCNQNIRPV